jgi:phosphoenolpyruvate carboxylase
VGEGVPEVLLLLLSLPVALGLAPGLSVAALLGVAEELLLAVELGVGAALADAIADGQLRTLQEMYDSWPFFKSTVDLIEMVLTKADMRVQKVYEDALCSGPDTRAVGQQLREAYAQCVAAVLAVTRHRFLSESSPQLRRLIDARAPFINVINFAQVETLRRLRQDGSNADLRNALLISINGIAAGMRNTG